jgi:hypothetical protein
MKRVDLEKYLGKRVNLIFFDDQSISGILCSTSDKRVSKEMERERLKNYYFLVQENIYEKGNLYFKCSHVKKLSEIGGIEYER